MGSKKKVGLVLSGGGTRSLAHIGLIKALEEEGIFPHKISGTSGGALVGALYASGVAPEDMLQFFEEVPMFKLSLFTFKKPGVIDSAKYPEIFKKFLKVETFEDLRLPLTVTTTNLLTGRVEYFSKGDLLKPLIASSAYPPYFSPVEIGDNIYTDGGILNNFPTEPILAEDENLLGSFVSPIIHVTKKDINSTFKLLQRIYNIGTDASYYAKFKQCNYVFIPTDIQQIGTLDTKNIHKAFDMGYEQAKAQMPQILASLNY